MKTLVEVLKEFEVEVLPSSSGRFVAKCPFHEGDRTPSFTIYPNNTYFCFSCHVWGDAVKYLIEKHGFTPDGAAEYVGEDQSPPRKQVIKVENKNRLWPFLYEVTEAYHQNLLQTPGAIMYCQARGLSLEAIKKYRLGYTDGGVLNLQHTSDVQLALRYGVINEKGYEILSHRITIPNFAEDESVDFIVGRTVTHDRIKYLGIRTPKPIFGLVAAWESPILFLAEGQFDWLTLREWGLPAVVLGGNRATSHNIAVLRERKIVIVPDNDASGIGAAIGLKAKLGKGAIVLDYADLGAKDVGELGPKEGAKEQFLELVKEQVEWYPHTSQIQGNLVRLFPALKTLIPLNSTSKQRDSHPLTHESFLLR